MTDIPPLDVPDAVENRGEPLAPEDQAAFFEFWGPIVCPHTWDLNQVMRELVDYAFLMDQVPSVYMEITGGLLSKPNYRASTVIAVHDENCRLVGSLIDDIRDHLSCWETDAEKLEALEEVLENNDTIGSRDREHERRVAEGTAPTIQPLTTSIKWVSAVICRAIIDTYPMIYTSDAILKTIGDGRLERIMRERTFFEARSPEGDVLGVAAVEQPGMSGESYVSTIFVTDRGKGIGSALTDACLTWAEENGATSAVATTNDWNRASIANLTRHGFVETNRDMDRWLYSGEIIEMRVPLPRNAPQ